MQRRNVRHSSELSITFPSLSKLNESSLLEIAISKYKAEHPLEKPHHAIAAKIGIPLATFDQAVAGKGSIGLVAWRVLGRLIGRDLASEFLAAEEEDQ